MDRQKVVADLKKIASDIDFYAESLVSGYEKLRDFSISIDIVVDGDEISTWSVSQEFGV